jgi:hypothetical protein
LKETSLPKAVPQLKRLVACPGSIPVQVGFVVDEVTLEQFILDYLVFPASSHSTDCSTLIIYHPGLVK